jgi:lipopolysaccharide transport system ATP-binding protein
MSPTVISVENLSKAYRLGQIGTGTLKNDLAVWWAKTRGKPNPLMKIGQDDHGNRDGEIIWALKDINFTVLQGEILGIIGKNGAGKSTLLKIISRVTAPTSGQIKLRGRISSLLEVGTGFHPELTGRENIYLNGAIMGMSKEEIHAKIEEIIDFSEVGTFIDTPVKRYSSGMYVRLAFSVAAHLDPEILIVDEVLAVGDAAFQKKSLGKMEDVAKKGRTILFVSHNMNAIASITKTCAQLDNGKIVSFGLTEEIIRNYLATVENKYINGFSDLKDFPRSLGYVAQKARFIWVRISDNNNNCKNTFDEGEPIIFEIGFEVLGSINQVQFGLGVSNIRYAVELFVVPSLIYSMMVYPGKYSIKMYLNPNYLREGNFTVTLKMFAKGERQDTLSNSINFSIIKSSSDQKNEGTYARWIAGLINLSYDWSEINKYPE